MNNRTADRSLVVDDDDLFSPAQTLRRYRHYYRFAYEGYRRNQRCLMNHLLDDRDYWNASVSFWLAQLRFYKPRYRQAIAAYYQEMRGENKPRIYSLTRSATHE